MQGESAPEEQWLFPGMRVADLLRARPAALTVLEAFGIDPFARWLASLDSLVPAWRDLEASLAALETPFVETGLRKTSPGPSAVGAAARGGASRVEAGRVEAGHGQRAREGSSMPELLDLLVRQHAGYLEDDLPAIRRAMAEAFGRGAASRRPDSPARQWDGFSESVLAHIREEESFLFPRLLHYDYCVRHNGCHPDFTGGSVTVFVAIRLLGNERAQMAALRGLLKGLESPDPGTVADAALDRLRGLLERFHESLVRHHGIEEGELFPRARALEKALLDAAISGGKGAAATARSA